MLAYAQLLQSKGIIQVNGIEILTINDSGKSVETSIGELKTNATIITVNGFAKQFIEADVQPARAQVIVTSEIPNLPFKGTFHYDQGYYYFRNIGNRILLGGGRNLDFDAENTSEFGQTQIVQKKLEQLLKEVILPNQNFQIAHRWSGIMGIGNSKNPIVTQLSDNVYCGVRLGGMGVAIGSLIGTELADLI